MTDTQPFMDEARDVLTGRRLAFDNGADALALVIGIATALSSAYQRGREEERERCAKIADKHAAENWGHTEEENAGQAIATAIRTQRDKG